jgi:hypothetical protein
MHQMCVRVRERETEREGGREREREGGREGGREGWIEGGREGGREEENLEGGIGSVIDDNNALLTLAHAAGKHVAKVLGARVQDSSVHVNFLPLHYQCQVAERE